MEHLTFICVYMASHILSYTFVATGNELCYFSLQLARYCSVVLARSGNCTVSGLQNREVSAIEGL